jgi:hypothetical protein
MKFSKNFEFSRRTLLRAAGSTLLVPTFIKQSFAQTATKLPSLCLMMQTNGTHQASFWPTGTTFDSDILHALITDPVVGPKTTLIKGINLNKQGNPPGNGHDWGWNGLYSGVDNISMGAPFSGGPSLDQILINKINFSTPFPNIHCGAVVAHYSLINAGRASFSYSAAAQQVPVETDIYSLYTKVFGSVTTTASTSTASAAQAKAAAMLRLTQRKSVLDAVATDLTTLEARLGPTEAAKVGAHLTAVREFETRLSDAMTPGDDGVQSAQCKSVQPSQTGVLTTAEASEANADPLNQLYMEFIANAMGCNMVGVITFQFGRGGDHYHYGWLNNPLMPADFHNQAAHKDTGSDADAANVMINVGQYHAGLMQKLGTKLASFPAANGGTALDNSLAVWGNELATGPHGIQGYPIVFIGGAAGKLTKTGYMVDVGTQVHQRLGCTIENIMGIPSTGFGWVTNSGPFLGLGLAT